MPCDVGDEGRRDQRSVACQCAHRADALILGKATEPQAHGFRMFDALEPRIRRFDDRHPARCVARDGQLALPRFRKYDEDAFAREIPKFDEVNRLTGQAAHGVCSILGTGNDLTRPELPVRVRLWQECPRPFHPFTALDIGTGGPDARPDQFAGSYRAVPGGDVFQACARVADARHAIRNEHGKRAGAQI